MDCSTVSASCATACFCMTRKPDYECSKAAAAKRQSRVMLSASRPSLHNWTASLTTPPSPAPKTTREPAPKAPSSVPLPRQLARVTDGKAERSRREEKPSGLGIVEFLRGKNFLIAGSLGLLGKGLIEKILRVQPDVGQIFLLLRPKNGKSGEARLYHEVINSELFRPFHKIYGESCKDFLKSKLTIIMGDVTLQNLGIYDKSMRKLLNQVHIVVNSSATTTFDERYDDALQVNARGAQNVIEFSKQLSSLQLVMHVSTAYVNGHKEGIAYEDPLILEQILPMACNERHPTASLCVYEEEKIVQKMKIKMDCSLKSLALSLKDLGMERATKSGSFNTYVFTKALGELLINETRKDVPVVVVRPSIIQSTMMEPFGGWLEGNRMGDPIITAYAKGQIRGFVGTSSTLLDMVPLDMVLNAMLAIITKHANKSGLEVYHMTLSSMNPISFGDLMRFSYQHFNKSPYIDRYGNLIEISPFRFHPNVNQFLHDESRQLENEGEISSKERVKFLNYLKRLASIYTPYSLVSTCKFDNSKTRDLYCELSFGEKQSFNFDVESIDWEHFIENIHIPGLRKHVHKNGGNTVQ